MWGGSNGDGRMGAEMAQRMIAIPRSGLDGAARAVPGLGGSAQALARIAALSGSGVAPVAWSWLHLGRVVLSTARIVAAGLVSLLVARVLIVAAFDVAASMHMVGPQALDTVAASLAPGLPAAATVLLGLLLYGALGAAIVRHILQPLRLPWSELYIRRASAGTCLRALSLLAPLTVAGMSLTRLTGPAAGAGHPVSELTRGITLTLPNGLLLFLLLVVLAPIAEEVFFRGVLYRLLRGQLPGWAAAAGAALPFAASHGNPALLPWLFLTGVTYGLVVERTRSLACAIVLHAAVNTLAWAAIMISLPAA